GGSQNEQTTGTRIRVGRIAWIVVAACLLAPVIAVAATRIYAVPEADATFGNGHTFSLQSHLSVTWSQNSGGQYQGLSFGVHSVLDCGYWSWNCNSDYHRFRAQQLSGANDTAYFKNRLYKGGVLQDQNPPAGDWFAVSTSVGTFQTWDN